MLVISYGGRQPAVSRFVTVESERAQGTPTPPMLILAPVSPSCNLSSAQWECHPLPDTLSVHSDDLNLSLLNQTLSRPVSNAASSSSHLPPLTPTFEIPQFTFQSPLRVSTPALYVRTSDIGPSFVGPSDVGPSSVAPSSVRPSSRSSPVPLLTSSLDYDYMCERALHMLDRLPSAPVIDLVDLMRSCCPTNISPK